MRNWLSGLPVDDIDMAINLPIGIVSAHLKKLGLKVIHSESNMAVLLSLTEQIVSN